METAPTDDDIIQQVNAAILDARRIIGRQLTHAVKISVWSVEKSSMTICT